MIESWCDLNGLPVDPPAGVRRLVEERAPPEPLGRAWRHAVWVPDAPSGAFVALLGTGDELRVVELE